MLEASLGGRIRRLRLEAGLTQQQAAVGAGLDTATWNQLERGGRNPSLKTLERVADELGVDVAALFAEEAQTPKAPAPHSSRPDDAGEERRPLSRLEEGRLISALLPLQRRLEGETAYWNELAGSGRVSLHRLEDATEALLLTARHFEDLVDASRRERWSDEEFDLLGRIYREGVGPHKAAWEALLAAYAAGHSASDLSPLRRRGDEAQHGVEEAGRRLRAVG